MTKKRSVYDPNVSVPAPQEQLPKSEFEGSGQRTLDEYLDDDFNQDIYLLFRKRTAASGKAIWRLIDPVVFFDSFYQSLSFVRTNFYKPNLIEKHLMEVHGCELVVEALLRYSEFLADKFHNTYFRNSRLVAYLKVLKEEHDKAFGVEKRVRSARPTPGAGHHKVVNTEYASECLDALPSDLERRKFLIIRRTEIRQRLRKANEYDVQLWQQYLDWIEDKMTEIASIQDLQMSPELPYEDLSPKQKLLAEICPLFKNARLETQHATWTRMMTFTRKQWVLFIIESTVKKTGSTLEIFPRLVKPKVKTLEEISGWTNLRSVSIREECKNYQDDLKKVKDVIKILRAEAVMLDAGL